MSGCVKKNPTHSSSCRTLLLGKDKNIGFDRYILNFMDISRYIGKLSAEILKKISMRWKWINFVLEIDICIIIFHF